MVQIQNDKIVFPFSKDAIEAEVDEEKIVLLYKNIGICV